LEVDLEELEPLEQLTAPLQAVIADLRGQLSAAQQQEFELGEFELRDGSAPPEAAAVPAPAPAPSAPTMKHEKAVSIWRDAAADGLAKMGSSLHGALMSDTKLREIFDHIDMDKGGTIDKNELRIALEGAGKNLSDQTITAMMNAADNDSNGEIEFEEFANIMKGVKANSAASTIGRKVRARQQSSKAKTKKGVTEVAKSKALDRRSLDRAVGEALLARKSNPQELVREWDRKQKGAINRIEFRQGCRESLGLNFDNKDLDEWFDKIDADKGGTIDVSELKTALRMLQEKAVSDQRVREELGARMVALKAKIAAMDALLDVTSAALNAATDAASKLAAHRALPAIDARIGEKLNSKLRSESHEKGADFDDLCAAWNVARKTTHWVDKEEFLKLASTCLTEVTQKRQKAEASKAGVVARTAEERNKEQMMTTEEKERHLQRTGLAAVNVSEEDVSALFDRLLAQKAQKEPRDERYEALLEIKPMMRVLMAADPARKQLDAALFETASSMRDAALEQQGRMKQVVRDFAVNEVAEAAAAEAKAKAEAEAAEEAKKEAAAAKKAAAASKPAAALPAYMTGGKGTEGEGEVAVTAAEDGAAAAASAAPALVAATKEPAVDVADADDALLSKLASVDGNAYNSPAEEAAAAPAPA